MAVDSFLRMEDVDGVIYDIVLTYDDQGRVTQIDVTFATRVRVQVWDVNGNLRWDQTINQGSRSYNIPPGQLRRYDDFVSIQIGPA